MEKHGIKKKGGTVENNFMNDPGKDFNQGKPSFTRGKICATPGKRNPKFKR